MNADLLEITPELSELASRADQIANEMDRMGHEDWQLGNVASRKLVWKLEERLTEAILALSGLIPIAVNALNDSTRDAGMAPTIKASQIFGEVRDSIHEKVKCARTLLAKLNPPTP